MSYLVLLRALDEILRWSFSRKREGGPVNALVEGVEGPELALDAVETDDAEELRVRC
jgi:hypothetical protein